MKRATISAVVVAALLFGVPGTGSARTASSPPDAACADRLCAGAASADITPPVGTPMWGYGARAAYSQSERWTNQRSHWVDTDLYAKALFLRSEGVHTRLRARALVLTNAAGVKLALVQTDLGAVTAELHAAVAAEIAGLGITRDFLLLSATHTHGGAGAIQHAPAHGLLVGDQFDPRVFARVVDGVVKAVKKANARLAPARAGIGQGSIPDASVNRSLEPHRANPCPDPAAVEAHACDHGEEGSASLHAIDPTVTVLRVDRSDGVPLGAWTSFAAHGTMFYSEDMRFSGDNQGYAERMVERGIADRAEAKGIVLPEDWDVVAAYANGTEGDVAPAGVGKNRFIAAEDSGRRQATAVLKTYDGLAGQLVDDLPLDARWDWVYMTGDEGTSPVPALGAGPDCPFGKGGIPEALPGQGRKCPLLPLVGGTPSWFGIQMLRIGSLGVASVPGEMTVQMGRRLRKRILDSPFNQGKLTSAIVVGLANDYMAYITTPEEYDVQAYEGTFTLWGRNQGQLFTTRYGRLTDALLGGPQVSYVEPPTLSGVQSDDVTPSQPLSPVTDRLGPEPGSVLNEVPASVERGSVVGFTWVGGEPSVELQPDVPFVTVQRLVPVHEERPRRQPKDARGNRGAKEDQAGAEWTTVFTDDGYEDLLDYWRDGVVDRWGTQWDVPFDAPDGLYRFVVHGRAWREAQIVGYEASSRPFRVVASDDVSVQAVERVADGVVVRGGYPEPSGNDHPNFGQPRPYMHDCSAARPGAELCGNFRWRPAHPNTGQVTVEVVADDGGIRTLRGSFDEQRGGYFVRLTPNASGEVRVPAGGLVDTWGNFNALATAR